MSLELFRYGCCGGLNLALEWVLYYVFYHFVFHGKVFHLGFLAFTPHIAAFIFKFPITFLTGFWMARHISFSGSTLRGRTQVIRYLIVTVVNITAILCGLSGLLIAGGLPRVPVLNFIGEHSMVYFVSHYPILYYVKYMHLCFGRSIFGRYDEVLILLPAIFLICSWMVPYIERTPWLSGRWPKRVKSEE